MRVIPWCGVLLLITAHAYAADCADWHSREYFKTANPAQVGECLAAGADLQAHGALTNPPLHEAAWATPDAAVINALLAAGADAEALAGDGTTALHWAALNADAAVATLLTEAGADPNASVFHLYE